MFALSTLALVDSISFMIVMPSLAFYVTSLGGSQDFYGFVLSVYSFTSFCGKPILGRWSDAYNFQVPYMVSIALSVVGGLFYAIAPSFTNHQTALTAVALGRILGGLGRANSALGFAYVARACSSSQRTSVTAILGGVQMVGMSIAPIFSAFISDVEFYLFGIHFDYLNTVGLIMVIINLFSGIIVHLYLPDLESVEDSDSDTDEDKESEWLMMFRCILNNQHIGVPFLTIFVFNFNWQFIETAVAPAAFDTFEWGPVQVSYVLGVMAVLVFVGMASVHKLSNIGISDFILLVSGLVGNTIGYFMLYLLWYRGVYWALFIVPVFVGAGSFPFLGAPNRSLFSAAVDATPQLAGYEGTMQALLSMSSSIGGFVAPTWITHYCLRTPEEVAYSIDNREFTPMALLSPLLSLAVLVATINAGEPNHDNDEKDESEDKKIEVGLSEVTPLVKKFEYRRRSDGDAHDHYKPTTMIYNKRRSDGNKRDNIENPPKSRSRRHSLRESARNASIRGLQCAPMAFSGDIWDDEEEDNFDEEDPE